MKVVFSSLRDLVEQAIVHTAHDVSQCASVVSLEVSTRVRQPRVYDTTVKLIGF